MWHIFVFVVIESAAPPWTTTRSSDQTLARAALGSTPSFLAIIL